ncbi:MAG: hypothetical protein LBK60_06510 [Verrucomicrobiales bacterium]|jgi:hypothetical protein|nr:hypothetical protein [Verrucomicrobiales bacterium]
MKKTQQEFLELAARIIYPEDVTDYYLGVLYFNQRVIGAPPDAWTRHLTVSRELLARLRERIGRAKGDPSQLVTVSGRRGEFVTLGMEDDSQVDVFRSVLLELLPDGLAKDEARRHIGNWRLDEEVWRDNACVTDDVAPAKFINQRVIREDWFGELAAALHFADANGDLVARLPNGVSLFKYPSGCTVLFAKPSRCALGLHTGNCEAAALSALAATPFPHAGCRVIATSSGELAAGLA